MKSEAKWTTTVVWAEIQFKVGTECLRIEPPRSTQSLFSPQNTAGVFLL
jgi:hypothetical protein